MIKNGVQYLMFPACLVSGFAGFWSLMEAGITPGVALFSVTIAHVALISLLEMLMPLNDEWAWWRDRQSINDLLHGLALSTIGPKLGELLFFGGATAVAVAIAENTGDAAWPNHWPFWLQFVLAAMLVSFTDWAKHWMFHRFEFWWRLHALHHDQDKLHIFVGARLHFLESTVRYAVLYVPFIMLGAEPILLLWIGGAMNFLGNLNHSNIKMPEFVFMHYLIQTQGNHHIHHSKDADLGGSNLSAIFMLPDILFGTFRPADKYEPGELGIEDNPVPASFLAQLLAPFNWKSLKAAQLASAKLVREVR